MRQHIVQEISGFPDQLDSTKQIHKFLKILNYVHKYIPRLVEKIKEICTHLNGGFSDVATKAVRQLKR